MDSEEEEVVGRRDLTDHVGVERRVAGSTGGGEEEEEEESRVVGCRRTGRRDLNRHRVGRRIVVVMVKNVAEEGAL
jgi:hypothetical protein